MRVNIKELLMALETVKEGVMANASINEWDGVYLLKDKIRTFSDTFSVQCSIDLGDIEGNVNAATFYNLINKISGIDGIGDTVEMSILDDTLSVKVKRIKSGMPVIAEMTDLDHVFDVGDWDTLPDDFISALQFCIFSAGSDVDNAVMTCLNISQDFIISSDNKRITKFKMTGKMTPFLLPVIAARKLIKYLIIEYQLNDSWAQFRTKDDVIISCRSLDAEFPDVDRIMNFEGGSAVTFPDNI